jgi:hypothetical protein
MHKTDERRLISAEMYFMRRAVGYSLSDCKRNEEVIIYTDSVHKKIYRTVNKKPKNRLMEFQGSCYVTFYSFHPDLQLECTENIFPVSYI